MKLVFFIVLIGIIAMAAYFLRGSGSGAEKKKKKPKGDFAEMSLEELRILNEARASVQKKEEKPDDENKVVCSYCESYVDYDENEICPNCGASIADEIEEAKRKKANIELRMMEIEAEMERDRQKNERVMKTIDLVKSAAVTSVSPVVGRTIYKNLKKKK